MILLMKKSLPLFAALALTGCALLSSPKTETRYALAPVMPLAGAPAATAAQAHPRTVMVDRPNVPQAYHTGQLVLLQNGVFSYYQGQSWEAPLADFLSAAYARDLPGQLPGQAVVADDSGLRSDVELQTTVNTFATVQTPQGPVVIISVDLRAIDPATRKVLRSLPFRFRQQLPSLTTSNTVAAFNAGWQQLILQAANLLR